MQDTYTEFKNTPAAFEMLLVEGGVFEMGGESWSDSSLPVHGVKLDSFWMGEFAVTQALWAYVMAGTDKEDPSDFKGVNHPVENVSYEDIVNEFLPRLKTMTGHTYRLPTEAEWEYAARGGKYWKQYPFFYAGSNKLEEVGWDTENSHYETQTVGLKTPNLLGFCDMSGNVWEWCSDWYDEDFYKLGFCDMSGNVWEWGSDWDDGDFYKTSNAAVSDNPTGPTRGTYRVTRGGSWNNNARDCRSTSRYYDSPSYGDNRVGFRLVLPFSISSAGINPVSTKRKRNEVRRQRRE